MYGVSDLEYSRDRDLADGGFPVSEDRWLAPDLLNAAKTLESDPNVVAGLTQAAAVLLAGLWVEQAILQLRDAIASEKE